MANTNCTQAMRCAVSLLLQVAGRPAQTTPVQLLAKDLHVMSLTFARQALSIATVFRSGNLHKQWIFSPWPP